MSMSTGTYTLTPIPIPVCTSMGKTLLYFHVLNLEAVLTSPSL